MYTDELYHVGTPQMYDGDPNGSGRYRQGSGSKPYQHSSSFRTRYLELKEKYGGYFSPFIPPTTKLCFDLASSKSPSGVLSRGYS